MLIPALLSLAALLPGTPAATKPVEAVCYLAVGDKTGFKPFLASYQHGRFIKLPKQSNALDHFKVGTKLTANSSSGIPVLVLVKEINYDPFPYEPVILIKGTSGKIVPDLFPLLTLPAIPIQELPTFVTELTPKEVQSIRNQAQHIWTMEITKVPDEDKPSTSFSITSMMAISPANHPDKLLVTASVTFSRYSSTDKRGRFFFLFDRVKQTFLLSRFGHPEWFPGTPNSVVTISPTTVFIFKGVPTPFLLADYDLGWEYSGNSAIINLQNGHIEATTE